MKNFINFLSAFIFIILLLIAVNWEVKSHAADNSYILQSCYYIKSVDVVVNNNPVTVVIYDCADKNNMGIARFIAVDKAAVINEDAAQKAALDVDAASEFFAVLDRFYFFKFLSIEPVNFSKRGKP